MIPVPRPADTGAGGPRALATTPPVFELLLREENPEADDALLATLPGADPVTAGAVIGTLLARRRPAGLKGLIAHYHLLDEGTRSSLIADVDELFRTLRESFAARVEQTRLNVVQVIAAGRACRAAYLLDTALHDRSPAVRVAAAEALCGLADELLSAPPPALEPRVVHDVDELRTCSAQIASWIEDRRQVVGALESGIACFNVHLHPRVMEASMWLVDDMGPRFWALISDSGSRTNRAAGTALQSAGTPRMVAFCLSAIAHSGLRQYVSKLLAACHDEAFWSEFFTACWRIAQPRIARGLSIVRDMSCLRDHAVQLLELPPETLAHAPRVISCCGIPLENRIEVLRQLDARGDLQTRRATVVELADIADERAVAALRRIEKDPEPAVAELALLALARRLPNEYTPASVLARLRGDSEKAATTVPRSAPATFEVFWAGWDTMSGQERLARGRQLLTPGSSGMNMLGHHLNGRDPGARVRALRIVSELGLAGQFSEQIYRLCHDAHADVRSAAMISLGALEGPTTRLILRQGLADPDARVQANAIEAVEAAGDSASLQELVPKLGSSGNRIRANAVKALLKTGAREAAETLLLMLQDPARSHRISALWLVEHLGLVTLMARVLAMSASDEDPAVRLRAAQLAVRLQGQVQSGEAGMQETGVAAAGEGA